MLKKILIVVITSDKGLCGGFNSNLIKAATKTITENYAAQKKSRRRNDFSVGKKGFDFLKRIRN